MKVIASHNGLAAAAKARELLWPAAAAGGCVEGVTLIEDDPDEHTRRLRRDSERRRHRRTGCGRDGWPDPPRGRRGGAAEYPPSLAGRHGCSWSRRIACCSSAKGRLKFARANGFVEEDLLTDKARRIWLHWKRIRSPIDDWRKPAAESVDPDVQAWFDRHSAARRPMDASRSAEAFVSRSETSQRHGSRRGIGRQRRHGLRHQHQRPRLQAARPRRRFADPGRGPLCRQRSRHLRQPRPRRSQPGKPLVVRRRRAAARRPLARRSRPGNPPPHRRPRPSRR